MTPVHKTPTHNDRMQMSIVFDAKKIGREVVRFYGKNHRADSDEFCTKYHGFNKKGEAI